jgi:hypothetical protein
MVPFALSSNFALFVGLFYVNWSRIETTIDYAIGKFLNVSDKQAHIITTYIDFGRKASWLRELVKDSSDPKQGDIIKALNAIQNDSKRNIFAHSYISGVGPWVNFIEKNPHGSFSVRVHRFTEQEFRTHVDGIARHAGDLIMALGVSDDELDAFGQVALNMANS